MADDWAGLSAQLGKMQRGWYATQGSYWSVFDPGADTATIIAEDGSTRQVPSWRAMTNAINNRVISGQMTFTGVGNGSMRQTADIGSGFAQWRSAGSFLSLYCARNDAAYTIWRADSAARYLANCMVHARNYDSSSATVHFRVANGEMASQGDAVFEMLGDGTFTVSSPSGAQNVTLNREGHVLARGLIVPGAYTRATLPAANLWPTAVAYITDGPAGPSHVFSNGQKWRIPTMADL
ncbi:hypothetical protein AA0N74_01645 [Chromobacterium vaccinii]|uniref:hypothetical protein n=1 Tax=Chromobacterium vaccinii TaxID=1108595 RepID=UPI0031D9AAC3